MKQKRGSLIGGFILLAAVGMWAVGFFVHNMQKPQSSVVANPDSTTVTVKEGFTLYENQNVSIQYPRGWSAGSRSDEPEWVYLASADYNPPQSTTEGPSVTAGYLLEMRVSKTLPKESFSQSLEQAKNAKGGNYKVIKIDGNEALLSTQKKSGTFRWAMTFHNEKTYYFKLNTLNENNPKVKALFTAILQTVKLK
jgi:hypothetical protein